MKIDTDPSSLPRLEPAYSDEDGTPTQLPWYRFRSPIVQNMIGSIILAMTPGIYLALTGLGAGGGKPTSATFANQVNVILYGEQSAFLVLHKASR